MGSDQSILIKELKEKRLIQPASYEIIGPSFEMQDESSVPSDLMEFIRLTNGFTFSLCNLEFNTYPGLMKKNLNEAYAWYPDQVFSEYALAYEFASSSQHPMSLGIDLSESGKGRIFFYEDTAHGTDSNSFYIARNTDDLIRLIETGFPTDFDFTNFLVSDRTRSTGA